MKGIFYDHWVSHGGVATFGYPLTEETYVQTFDGGGKEFPVQYFERNRMEFHDEIKNTSGTIQNGSILLSRLGAPYWDELKKTFTGRANVTVPDYTSTAPYL